MQLQLKNLFLPLCCSILKYIIYIFFLMIYIALNKNRESRLIFLHKINKVCAQTQI